MTSTLRCFILILVAHPDYFIGTLTYASQATKIAGNRLWIAGPKAQADIEAPFSCSILPINVRGFPYPFLVVHSTIPKGKELLYPYGSHYCEVNFSGVWKKII